MKVLVKICGIRTPEEARVALDSGADFLGFNFWFQSPRYCEPATAREIIKGLSTSVQVIGVFVNERKETVARLAEELGLSAVQLHGDESPEYCNDLSRSWRSSAEGPEPIIKAFRVTRDFDPGVIAGYKLRMALLDASVSGLYGGTGRVFDWKVAIAAKSYAPVMLAGGLDSQNVGEAITRARPAAIDVCSGVEAAPGAKDLNKLREFLQSVRDINESLEAASRE